MGQPVSDTESVNSCKLKAKVNPRKMSKVFNWEYFSYVTLDDAVAYKEVLVMPAVIFVLAVVWMQLVKGSNAEESQKEPTQRDISFEQAYQVCILDKSINNNCQNQFSGCKIER